MTSNYLAKPETITEPTVKHVSNRRNEKIYKLDTCLKLLKLTMNF